ncbi:MAG: 3-dehydroquinate synthase [Candidatus Deianiraeaceae bacterium]|jgi:3-dehydroquinate synthase
MKVVNVGDGKGYDILISQTINFGKEIKPFVKTNAVLVYDYNLPQKAITSIETSFGSAGIEYLTLKLDRSGESVKTFEYYQEVATKLIEMNTTRKTVLVAVGGGTVGDFVGFLASSFMRGIPFVQIPTTLLAMVDSSVGGKVAINLGHYKNCIGAFYQPVCVLIDISFLQTLPKIELVSGYAEVLKYGLIADENFLQYLLKNQATFIKFQEGNVLNVVAEEYFEYIVGHSCDIKATVVEQDERESLGIREILNFGHTFAHAFEGLYLGKIPHGIAVGIGMIYACKFSSIDCEYLILHYKSVGLYYSIMDFCRENDIPCPTAGDILSLMQKDKKNSGNDITLVLLESIGKAKLQNYNKNIVLEFLNKLCIDKI